MLLSVVFPLRQSINSAHPPKRVSLRDTARPRDGGGLPRAASAFRGRIVRAATKKKKECNQHRSEVRINERRGKRRRTKEQREARPGTHIHDQVSCFRRHFRRNSKVDLCYSLVCGCAIKGPQSALERPGRNRENRTRTHRCIRTSPRMGANQR